MFPKVPGRGTPSPVTMVAGGVNPRRANSLNSLNDQDCYMNSVWPKAIEKPSQVSACGYTFRVHSMLVQCGCLCCLQSVECSTQLLALLGAI